MNNLQCILNMDEKGRWLALLYQQFLLAQKEAKRVHHLGNKYEQNVTIVSCVNGVVNAVRPLIVFTGNSKK